MSVRIIHGQPTPDMVEKHIFEKWAGAFEQLAKGPSEPYPAFHEIDPPSDERERSATYRKVIER